MTTSLYEPHPIYIIMRVKLDLIMSARKFKLAFFVGDGGIGPGEVQGPDHVLVAVLGRDVQHGLSLGLITEIVINYKNC